MREQALDHAAINLSDSIDASCDALLDDDQLVQIFGTTYANCPEKFEYLPGEKACIKRIVAHVKQLVDDGTGKKLFKVRKTKRKKTDVFLSSSHAGQKSLVQTQNHSKLLQDLFDSASKCLNSFNVDMANWSENFVKVDVDATGTFGNIQCILCDPDESSMKHKPKRVSYFISSGNRSSFWVISNFKKHLEGVHSLKRSDVVETEPVKRKLPRKRNTKTNAKNVSIQDDQVISTKTQQTEHDLELDIKNESNDLSVELVAVDDQDSLATTHEKLERQLYTQISQQIREMVAAALINSEKQHEMEFKLINQPSKYVSLVKTSGDGNCLFSALAHQLWRKKINRAKQSQSEHEKLTKKLRSSVVEHILKTENYPMYAVALQDRVSELKDLADVTDLNAECKIFVRHVLSREGKWGGLESIKAISFMHRVNVLVINECGIPYLIKGSKEAYDRTLLIAYRLNRDAVAAAHNYNHYDSIIDMRSDDIFSLADFIVNRFSVH